MILLFWGIRKTQDFVPEGWTLRVSPFSIAIEKRFSRGLSAAIFLLEKVFFMLTPIYYFDQDAYFSRSGRAQKLQDGSILTPATSTQTKPDDQQLHDYFATRAKYAETQHYEKKPTNSADFVGLQISHKSQTEHDREMRKLLQDLVKADSEHYRVIRGSKEEGLWWGVEEIPEKTVDEVRTIKLSELDSAFMQWYENDATVTTSLGFVADSDARAMMDVNGLVTTLEAQPVETRASVAFMDASNQAHMLSLDQLKTVQVEIIQNGQSAYQQKWALRTAIESAQSKEELEAIEIKFTAEDFSS